MNWRCVRMLGTLVGLAVAIGSLSSCQKTEDSTVIAFLLASDSAARWQAADEPAFKKQVKRTCRGCEYVTYNAGGDAKQQAKQLSQALAAGADVIVLNAVSAETGEELVSSAGDIPVIAYDRFVAGSAYYVSYDATQTGTLQAEAAVAAVGAKGSILVVNGAQTDPNGVAIKHARDTVLAASSVKVLAELDPPDWSSAVAGAWVTQQLKRHPVRTVGAILVANDEQAAGAIDALLAAGVPRAKLPFITGQDAELTALRRIVRGEQAMTVHKPFGPEAQQAADTAVTLVTGGVVAGTTDYEGVPSFVLQPQAVTVANLTESVVRAGLYTTAEICDEATLARCEELGIH